MKEKRLEETIGLIKKDVQRILSSEQAIKDSLRDRFENLLD